MVCPWCYSFFSSPFLLRRAQEHSSRSRLVAGTAHEAGSTLHLAVSLPLSAPRRCSAGIGSKPERVLFQNEEGKDECTCLISYKQLNTSSFPLPLIPNLQPAEQLGGQKRSTAVSPDVNPTSPRLYSTLPGLSAPGEGGYLHRMSTGP